MTENQIALRGVLTGYRIDVEIDVHDAVPHGGSDERPDAMIMTSRALRRATERVSHLRSDGRLTDGFTLIELLVVISLVMILSAVAMASYNQAVIRAKEAALKSDLFHMRDAINQYYADRAKYPDSLQILVSEGYLRAIPRDQFMDSTDTWVTAQAEPQPGITTTTTGICDVKSGSDKIALDGSRYSDW